jgi:hypothetical protein
MKMLDFLLHTQGYDLDILHMRAPYGETVIDPKSRPVHWSQRHMHEIRQRFPQSHYRQYPQYSKPAIGAYTWHAARAGARVVPIVGIAALTYSVLRAIPPSQPDSYGYDQRMEIAHRLFNPKTRADYAGEY